MGKYGVRREESLRSREKKETEEYRKAIKRFRLSVEELVALKTEIKIASTYCDSTREGIRKRISELESAEKSIKERIEKRWDEGVMRSLRRDLSTLKEEKQKRSGLFASLLNREVLDEYDEKIRSIESKLSLAHNQVYAEINKESEPLKREISNLSRLEWEIDWWNQPDILIARREIVARGIKLTLGESISPLSWCEALVKAIDLLIDERKSEDALDMLRSQAAANAGDTRKLATAIKRKIAHQTKILNVCPYCGIILDLKTAHADHIYPVAKGGHSNSKNMVYVCEDCNKKKKDKTLTQFIKLMGYDRAAIEHRLELLGKDF